MNNLLGDLRYGARMLGKRPGLSALAIVALAVGVGLTTTMFSIVYAMVLKGLPYERSDRLAAIFRDRPAQGIQFMPVGIHDFTDWREQQKSFDAIAAFYAETVNVSGSEGQPVRYLGAYASANLFDILRVRPMLGTHLPTRRRQAVHCAGDDPELPGLAGPIPWRPTGHRQVRPDQ